MKRVLITGAYGFLGRHTALFFKKNGYEVIGIGHGRWDFDKPEHFGIDHWIEALLDFPVLNTIKGDLDCVVHCAGGASVGYSMRNPLEDFEKTVGASVQLLEYIRVTHPDAYFIYPSSAAVYGDVGNINISESQTLKPISPYGFHKKIVEELCSSYAINFGLNFCSIRFFSIYGAGLTKQLLWDASRKIFDAGNDTVSFSGTGEEMRDWIHVYDATRLICFLAELREKGELILNGGFGESVTNKYLLNLLVSAYGKENRVSFDGENRMGDPKYYSADMKRVQKFGWLPQISLVDGVQEYADWYVQERSH